MKTAILISLVAFFATTSNAQTITGRDEFIALPPATLSGGFYFNIDSIPKHCWGQSDTIPALTKEDKQALRLYSKLQWYDFSTYRFKGEGKRAVWISYAVAGILHGGREAYHAEPTVFEKRFGVGPQSFFGSEQWKRQYFKRDHINQAHKPELWNSARDYWHFSHLASSTIWVGGAFTIGMSKQPMKYKLVDILIGTLITSGTASITYNILR